MSDDRIVPVLRIEGEEPPAAGVKVMAEGKEAGAITSAAYSPALACVVALAFVRAEFVRAASPLTAGKSAAQVVQH